MECTAMALTAASHNQLLLCAAFSTTTASGATGGMAGDTIDGMVSGTTGGMAGDTTDGMVSGTTGGMAGSGSTTKDVATKSVLLYWRLHSSNE